MYPLSVGLLLLTHHCRASGQVQNSTASGDKAFEDWLNDDLGSYQGWGFRRAQGRLGAGGTVRVAGAVAYVCGGCKIGRPCGVLSGSFRRVLE